MFLSKEELKEFTGHTYAKCQARYLANKGYPFEINAKGEVKLLITMVEQKLNNSRPRIRQTEPNFDSLMGLISNGKKKKGH